MKLRQVHTRLPESDFGKQIWVKHCMRRDRSLRYITMAFLAVAMQMVAPVNPSTQYDSGSLLPTTSHDDDHQRIPQ